jgi:acetyl-CoA carboxylase biotin carboxylase subunit
VIVWAEDRPTALARARRALSEFELEGVPSTRALAIEILGSADFAEGRYTTSFLDGPGRGFASLNGGGL